MIRAAVQRSSLVADQRAREGKAPSKEAHDMNRKNTTILTLAMLSGACDAGSATEDSSAHCQGPEETTGAPEREPEHGDNAGSSGDSDEPSRGGADRLAMPPGEPDDDPTWTSPAVLRGLEMVIDGAEQPGIILTHTLPASATTADMIGVKQWYALADFEQRRIWAVGRDDTGETQFIVGIEPLSDGVEIAAVFPDFARLTVQNGHLTVASLTHRPDIQLQLVHVGGDLSTLGVDGLSNNHIHCDPALFGWMKCGMSVLSAAGTCVGGAAACASTGGVLCPAGGLVCGTTAGLALCECANAYDKSYGC